MYKNTIVGKIKCCYDSVVVESASNKRKQQLYKVIAGNHLREDFLRYLSNARATEKVDGTSCLIAEHNGRPWLWARHDVKPNKQADRRFKDFCHRKNTALLEGNPFSETFTWDTTNDFKTLPDDWRPARNGDVLVAGENGHLVGWVPVDPSSRSHLWHLSVVDLTNSQFLCVTQPEDDTANLVVKVLQLKDYVGKTFELFGTKVNANPYEIGRADCPLHFLVQHGEISIVPPPDLQNKEEVKQCFAPCEGIVWHAEDGTMFKLHRHHLELSWPVKDTRFSTTLPVTISVESNTDSQSKLFKKLAQVSNRTFPCLRSVLLES